MAAKKGEQTRPSGEAGVTNSGPPVPVKDIDPGLKDPSQGAKSADTGEPGGGRGRVDVTGIVPDGIRVDPDLTEGHPGYDESGDSEFIPTDRLTEGGASEQKGSD